jgi:hypothetical protein
VSTGFMHCKEQYISRALSYFHRPPLHMAITRRPKVKTSTLTVRIDPRIKAAAEAAAERDHRSLTSLLEVLIINHCRTLGLSPEHFAKDSRQ